MVKIDPEKCIGCGLCNTICPIVFKLNPVTGKSEVASQELTGCDIDNAINSCPTQAITKE